MKEFEIIYSHIELFYESQFDERYQHWITDELSKHSTTITFKKDSMVLKAPDSVKLLMACMFIGYAYGRKSAGY